MEIKLTDIHFTINISNKDNLKGFVLEAEKKLLNEAL